MLLFSSEFGEIKNYAALTTICPEYLKGMDPILRRCTTIGVFWAEKSIDLCVERDSGVGIGGTGVEAGQPTGGHQSRGGLHGVGAWGGGERQVYPKLKMLAQGHRRKWAHTGTGDDSEVRGMNINWKVMPFSELEKLGEKEVGKGMESAI